MALEPRQERVFFYEKATGDEALELLPKMLKALAWNTKDVACLKSQESFELGQWKQAKKILFFGCNQARPFGEFIYWQGHQVMGTHSLESLVETPDLKKETWAHLKLFKNGG